MKAHYDMVEAKVVTFDRECSALCTCLNEVSFLLEEVKQSGFPITLASRITKLEKLLEEKELGAN